MRVWKLYDEHEDVKTSDMATRISFRQMICVRVTGEERKKPRSEEKNRRKGEEEKRLLDKGVSVNSLVWHLNNVGV